MHSLRPAELPGALGGKDLVVWRIDPERFADSWDRGIGAERYGGRWNAKGTFAVYTGVDPSTAIVENAVHRGFKALDTEPHVLSRIVFTDVSGIHVVQREDVPNPQWLHPGTPSAGQMLYGSKLLWEHGIVLFPSVIAGYSWNLVFEPSLARGKYRLDGQERFALDGRLYPPA